jgi:hypothetical protein
MTTTAMNGVCDLARGELLVRRRSAVGRGAGWNAAQIRCNRSHIRRFEMSRRVQDDFDHGAMNDRALRLALLQIGGNVGFGPVSQTGRM